MLYDAYILTLCGLREIIKHSFLTFKANLRVIYADERNWILCNHVYLCVYLFTEANFPALTAPAQS